MGGRIYARGNVSNNHQMYAKHKSVTYIEIVNWDKIVSECDTMFDSDVKFSIVGFCHCW